MRLRQLYEEEPKELKPGEREPIDVKDFQDLQKLNKKISEYENSLITMGKDLKVPKDQREALEKMKKATQDKLDSLYQEQVTAKQESEVDGIPKPLYNLLERISEECSDIVSVYKSNGGKFVYRGAKSSQDAFRGRPYDTRKAKDSDQRLSDALNDALDQAGVKARRDNSIFTSASYGQASNFGTSVFVIFPKDGYSFSCSRNIKDFVFDFGKLHQYFIDENLFDEFYETLLDKFSIVEKYFGTSHPFVSYKEKFDLLRRVDDFDIVKKMVEDGVIDKKFKNLAGLENVITPDKAVKNLDIFTEDISEAIDIKHEITITGEYYAINDRYTHYIKDYFLNNEKPESQEYSDDLDFKIGDRVEVIKDKHAGKQGKISYIYKISLGDIEVDTGSELIVAKKENLKKISDAEFKVGDTVQVVNGPKKGTVGEITLVLGGGGVEIDDETIIDDESNLKKLDTDKSVDSVNGYKINDTVNITKGEGKNKTGEITMLLPKEKKVVVKIQTSVGVQQLPVHTDDIELNNHPDNDFTDLSFLQEPKLGDYVKITGTKGVFGGLNNKEGKVTNEFKDTVDVELKGHGLEKSIPKKYVTVVKSAEDQKSASPSNPQPQQSDSQKTKEPDSIGDIISKATGPKNKPKIDAQTLGSNFKKLLDKGKKTGTVTYDEFNKVLVPGQVSDDQVEEAIDILSDLGIQIVEN